MLYRLLTILDWALIAASLFNTIAMLWLGLTVLLTAERRSWGTYAAAGGLILGGLFFVGHTAVVGRVLGEANAEMLFYWRLGWLVLILAPYLWYAVMAWYAGALRERGLRGERVRLAVMGALGMATLALAALVDPLPGYGDLTAPPGTLGDTLAAARVLYPAYAMLCIVLALSVLRAPGASDRFMGDLARRRARPWLVAASLVLLTICLVVGIGAAALLELLIGLLVPALTPRGIALLIAFDLVVCLLIAVAVVLIGQAVVAYEVFTGSALPRGELARGWRRALIFAGGYGLAVGWSLSGAGIPGLPIYQLLLATVIPTVFLALVGWRAFAERGPGLERLRPFFASQHLYERLTGPAASPAAEGDDAAPFRALVGELLGARVGYLLPLGPMAEMAGPPLAHPPGRTPPPAAALAAALAAPPPLCAPVDPEAHGGAVWAVPLRGERGLIGLLLLGEKLDGGVYTREEVELARAAGERIVDARAGAEMARRLVALQRRRLAESQVLDRRTRRVLHDEVLPQIHTAILGLAELGAAPAAHELQSQLAGVHRQISDLLHALPPAPGDELARLGPLAALRRAVDSELAGSFDAVRWELPPAAEAAARALDPIGAETLYYAAREAVRNAARHGRGADPGRPLHLRVAAARRPDAAIELLVEDDGVGLSPPRAPAESGGHGLALHGTILAILGGSLDVDSAPGGPTRVTLRMPVPAAGGP